MTRESHGVTGYQGQPEFTHPGEAETPESDAVRLLGYTPVRSWCTLVGQQRPLMLGQAAGFPFVNHGVCFFIVMTPIGGEIRSLSQDSDLKHGAEQHPGKRAVLIQLIYLWQC